MHLWKNEVAVKEKDRDDKRSKVKEHLEFCLECNAMEKKYKEIKKEDRLLKGGAYGVKEKQKEEENKNWLRFRNQQYRLKGRCK